MRTTIVTDLTTRRNYSGLRGKLAANTAKPATVIVLKGVGITVVPEPHFYETHVAVLGRHEILIITELIMVDSIRVVLEVSNFIIKVRLILRSFDTCRFDRMD